MGVLGVNLPRPWDPKQNSSLVPTGDPDKNFTRGGGKGKEKFRPGVWSSGEVSSLVPSTSFFSLLIVAVAAGHLGLRQSFGLQPRPSCRQFGSLWSLKPVGSENLSIPGSWAGRRGFSGLGLGSLDESL